MKKILVVLILSLLSVSMFSFTKMPILNDNKLFEIKGTIENVVVTKNDRFFFMSLKDKENFKAVFPNVPRIFNWFENGTNIALYGYYVELKNAKYFIPVKLEYKNRILDLRKEIARRLYEIRLRMYKHYPLYPNYYFGYNYKPHYNPKFYKPYYPAK
ncbi:hypothetical protein X275_10550 [Marinitoga sp. 1197]|uniref:hypothetical protein n=1 Tax=Marinitoga sp. 1197 TaxID=1428449 RepID=UPI000640C7CF|nr:hypothetical protein [Marinitoga sp. 1197]KLO21121.1 hypothetical protein X275_10550 [Marinitoga sp. 1197]